MAKIKAGYRLTVKSWENDDDHKNTIQKDGLSLEDTQFIVKIISLYKGNLGNIYEPSNKELKEEKLALRTIVDKYPNAKEMLGLIDDEDMKNDDAIVDCIHESILHEYMGSGEFYTRKCEGYTVEHVPFEVNIEDVTPQQLFSLKR
jgi:hypothetical protein